MNDKTCIHPDEIKAGDLIDYLEGKAPPGVVQHIRHCAFCAQQVEQLGMVDSHLLAAFYRDTCPAPDRLADFVLGRLADPDHLRVAAHLRECPVCSREVATLKQVDDVEPTSLLARLREALALALVARPVVQAAAPVRGESWSGRFEVNEFVITLSLQGTTLTGRIRRREAPADHDYQGRAWLLHRTATEETARQGEIDRRGRFQIASVDRGTYDLLLRTDEQHIALEGIQVV